MKILRFLPAIIALVNVVLGFVFSSQLWLVAIEILVSIIVLVFYFKMRARARLTWPPEPKARVDVHLHLLLSILSPENRKRFLTCGSVIVTGSLGNRYEIKLGTSMNVYSDRIIYCALPRNFDGSSEGVMLAQILMITTDELRFLRTASSQLRNRELR